MTSLQDFELHLEDGPHVRPPLWIFGPRSYLSDSAVPLPDIIAVPSRLRGGQTLEIVGRRALRATRNFSRRRRLLLHPIRSRTQLRITAERYSLDLRAFGIENWSHFLNKAFPVAIFVRDHLSRTGQPEPIFILRERVLPAVIQIMESFGLKYICTDNSIFAPQIEIGYSDQSVIDRFSRGFISSISKKVEELIDDVLLTTGDAVFLSRRPPSRSIENVVEIRSLLQANGFVEVFMEDFSALEQIAIILRAKKIVGIHGAGLAPLMFRNESHGPLDFVEIAHPGHVVPFFRDMLVNSSCTYRMVRGIPDKAMVGEAFSRETQPSARFKLKHSYKEFRLDPASLNYALESLSDKNFPLDTLETPI